MYQFPHRQSRGYPRPRTDSQIALARAATALAALSVGALAIGFFAVGRLAIGRLKLREGRIERLSIGELEVDRLRVRESADFAKPPHALRRRIAAAALSPFRRRRDLRSAGQH